MTIKKFTGETKEEAIQNAKDELGQSVVIMNVKEVRAGGLFGIFKRSSWEVTAALEDDAVVPKRQKNAAMGEGGHFDAVAGEKAVVNHSEARKAEPVRQPAPVLKQPETLPQSEHEKDALAEETLKSAFKAVSEVIKNSGSGTENIQPKPVSRNNIKKETSFSGNTASNTSGSENTGNNSNISGSIIRRPAEADFGNVKLKADEPQKPATNRQFVSMLYNVLLSNEVDEVYVNQIIRDMEKVIHSGNNLDYLLSNVYQKMVLMMGKPRTVVCGSKKPLVVFLIGPTGVGKTTTIAKLASRYKLNYGKNVGLLTTDTYRIAATDQLKTYANILEIPLDVVLTKDDINGAIEKMSDMDIIFVDTAGFSHKNNVQRKDMEDILNTIDSSYDKEIFLVLSATTKYRDLKDIVDIYKSFTDFSLIFTKLDETSVYGSILSTKLYAQTDLSYVSTGQGVPDDLEVVNIQHIVKQLLGGK